MHRRPVRALAMGKKARGEPDVVYGSDGLPRLYPEEADEFNPLLDMRFAEDDELVAQVAEEAESRARDEAAIQGILRRRQAAGPFAPFMDLFECAWPFGAAIGAGLVGYYGLVSIFYYFDMVPEPKSPEDYYY